MTRRRNRKKRVANQIRQLPWRDVRNNYAPVEILSADQVETIIETALDVLATQGMRFLEQSSRDLLQREGADVADDMVRFDPDLVREKMDITITPRSKSRQFQVPSSIRLRGSFEDPKATVSPVAAAFDAYAELITLLPRMVINMFGGKSDRNKSKRPCEAVN